MLFTSMLQILNKIGIHLTAFAMYGANTSELLVMPGATKTMRWEAKRVGVFPFYCTDFCSALHQEMQGYIRVSPKGSSVPLKFWTGEQE